MNSAYTRRCFGTHKFYVGVNAAGKTQGVMACTKKEANEELRRKFGFKAVKIVQS